MSRSSRKQFLATKVNRKPNPTRREVAKLLAKHVRKSLIAKGLVPNPADRKPGRVFGFSGPGTGDAIVRANTRGEARSKMKQVLGITGKGRLPKNIQITELDPIAYQPSST